MKYAIVVPLDQTIGYVMQTGEITIVHKEARLFDTEFEALKYLEEHAIEFAQDKIDLVDHIERICDEEEFKNRPDTW